MSLFLVGLSAATYGRNASSTGFPNKIFLEQTAAGRAIDASGTAEVCTGGSQQPLKASMDASVAPGTTFKASLLCEVALLTASTITIDRLRDSELELNTNNNGKLPSGLPP